MSGELKHHARVALAAKLITDWAKTHVTDAKHITEQLMNDVGADRVKVADDDGTELGSITITKGHRTAHISDPDAFHAWVMQRYPQHVHIIPTIEPRWLERTLNTASKLGTPVDTDTGEVIPGITITDGAPYLVTRSTNEAKQRMSELIDASGLLALTTPKETQ